MLLFAADIHSITGHSVIAWIIGGIFVAGLLFILFRWVKNASSRNDALFIQTTIEDLADWLDSMGLMNKENARTELQSVFNGVPTDSFRKHLLRLECKFLQISPSTCQQTTTMVFKKDNDIRETTFTRTVNWDTLPSDIRQEFILKN